MIDVIVVRDVTTFGHTVWVRDNYTGRLLGHDNVWHDAVPGAVPNPDHAFARIPDGVEHPLYGALAQALGSVEHPQQLRSDYLAERARVDRLIGMLDSTR